MYKERKILGRRGLRRPGSATSEFIVSATSLFRRGQRKGHPAAPGAAPQPHSPGEPGICGFPPGTGMYQDLGGLLELLGRMKEKQKMEETDARPPALAAREEG